MKLNNQGFTLLEVVFALAIFAVVLAGIPNFFVAQVQHNVWSERRTAAVAAAKQVLDVIRLEDPMTLPTTGDDGGQSIEVNDKTFDVTTFYCLEADYCQSTRNRHLRVEVEYDGDLIYDLETVYTQLQ